MKVFLINPDYMTYGDPPLGLAYLASYLKKKIPSVEVRILDQIPKEKIISIIKDEKPDVIGIGAVSENWFGVRDLARKIKKNLHDCRLVIGGVHITISPSSFEDSSFEDSSFDYGILGEGELAFTKLIEVIKSQKETYSNLRKIKGLLFRNRKRIVNNGISEQIENLDEIPIPSFNLLNMEYYSIPRISSGFKKKTMMLTSRGCPYNCKFCASSCFWGRRIRFFSAERVVDEIEYLYRRYGFNSISFADDLFSINEDRLKKIIILMGKRGLLGKIDFDCAARANLFKDSTAKLLKKMGIRGICFGFESGSEKVLHWLKNGTVTVEDNLNAIKICKSHNINFSGFFMIGSPYETLEDMDKTYKFIKNNCRNFMIYQTKPYPGTDVWRYAIKENIIRGDFYEKEPKEFSRLESEYLINKEVSWKEFEKMYNKIMKLKVSMGIVDFIKDIRNLRLTDIRMIFSKAFIEKVKYLIKK